MDKLISRNYYWMINTVSYSIDGVDVPKGRMCKMKKTDRRIVNDDWREAKKCEVITKKWHRGNYFNLKYV